jgi:hypothetical protein
MSGEEDWLLRPVLRGMCKYESLLDGRLGLADISRMNEALDVEAHNQQLLR